MKRKHPLLQYEGHMRIYCTILTPKKKFFQLQLLLILLVTLLNNTFPTWNVAFTTYLHSFHSPSEQHLRSQPTGYHPTSEYINIQACSLGHQVLTLLNVPRAQQPTAGTTDSHAPDRSLQQTYPRHRLLTKVLFNRKHSWQPNHSKFPRRKKKLVCLLRLKSLQLSQISSHTSGPSGHYSSQQIHMAMKR